MKTTPLLAIVRRERNLCTILWALFEQYCPDIAPTLCVRGGQCAGWTVARRHRSFGYAAFSRLVLLKNNLTLLRSYFIPGALAFLLPLSLPAASGPQSVEACRDLALAFLAEGCLDSVAHYRNLGAGLCEEEDNLHGWISLHRRIGQTFRDGEDHAMALRYFGCIFAGGWREPCTDEEYEQLAWAFTDAGYTYKRMNAFRQTADYYQKAATLFKNRLGRGEDLMAAQYIYSELGNAYSRLREYPKAEFYLKKRKDILEKEGGAEAIGAINDLGMLYLNWEKYPEAILVFTEGLATEGGSFSIRLTLLENLGMAYYKMGEPEKALAKTREAKARIGDSGLPQDEKEEHLIWAHENFACIYKAQSDFAQSEQHFSAALSLIRPGRPGQRRNEALLRIGRANLYLEMGRLEQSLEDYHRALQLFLPDFRDTSIRSLPEAQHLVADPNLIDALGGKARCFRAGYREKGAESLLRQALESYARAGQAELLLHQFYVLEGARLTAIKEHRWVREEAVETAFELWKTGPSPELEGQLFTLMESNRAMLLLETLKAEGAAASHPALYGQYERSRRAAILLEEALYAEQQKGGQADKRRVDSLYEQLLLAKEQKVAATRQILPKSVGQALPAANAGNAIPAVQDALDEDQMLLEYFLGENNAYLAALSRQGFKAWKIEFPDAVKEHVLSLREVWSGQPMLNRKAQKPRFARSAHLLYQWLLAEALAWKPADVSRLVVVTDGVLGFIPFEVLIRTAPEGDFLYANLDYLARDYSVSYAPSAGLFVLQANKAPGNARKPFAGFAPDYAATPIARADTSRQLLAAALVRDGNYELKGAKAEVQQAAGLWNGTPFMGLDASERAFKEQAGEYRVLLLSMHSMVNEDNPAFSRLLFTAGASLGAENDLLNALELGALRLQADLAVLSACNTGNGKLYPGEGVMSLSRAFFQAGVPSTVMTLWKIPDAQSSALVLAFFENLRAGMPKDVALQQAKLSYLENLDTPEEAHPFFWAGFITAGNARPLDGGGGGWVKWLVVGLVVLVAVSAFFGKRFPKR